MDEINEFFDLSKPFKRYNIPIGYVTGIDEDIEMSPDVKPRANNFGTSYVTEYKERELQNIKTFSQNVRCKEAASSSTLFHHEPLSSQMMAMEEMETDSNLKSNPKQEIYEKYIFTPSTMSSDLPIAQLREKILARINDNPVVVLQGVTGCGKTTQVPQYILDNAYNRSEYCNIVVTQPRKLAAASIALRVCEERNWQLGDVVGYQIGLSRKVSEDTRLLYCTTGVLLEKLILSQTLEPYTHIVLDEVHERDTDTDFLLLLVRRLLHSVSPSCKIILMSATIDSQQMADYFQTYENNRFISAPICQVDVKGPYEINIFHLCQLDKLHPPYEDVVFENPNISDNMYLFARKLVLVFDRIDNQTGARVDKNSILIFLPGIMEIRNMYKVLDELTKMNEDIKYLILPLHSGLTTEEQQKVFRHAPDNYRKIILSTNIAESSVTVPDVQYVIDFCLTKYQNCDKNSNFTSLELNWASKDMCLQRSGRVGRVKKGRVYRLVTKHFFDTNMREQAIPEILRSSLESVILKTKRLDIGQPHAVLALAPNPPDLSDIESTILVLKELGALLMTVNNRYDKLDGDLTYIGIIMAQLPIDVRLSRLIVFGYMFSILEETIIIGAALTVRNIFTEPFHNALAAYEAKMKWADGSGSDLIALLNAYNVYTIQKEQNFFSSDQDEFLWAQRYFIQMKAIKEVHLLVQELKERLGHIGIQEIDGRKRVIWSDRDKVFVLKVIIAGAFYPNYFLYSQNNDHNACDAFKILGERDPTNTVYFNKFDHNYIGPLYVDQIKQILSPVIVSKHLKVEFDQSEKIYVTFKNDPSIVDINERLHVNKLPDIPGRIQFEVYKALKLSKINNKHAIRVMRPHQARMYIENNNLGRIQNGMLLSNKTSTQNQNDNIIPHIGISKIEGYVVHVDHCNKFFFQPINIKSKIQSIQDAMNAQNSDLVPFENLRDVKLNMMVAAIFQDDKMRLFYRAVINGHTKIKNTQYYDVTYIDYGNTGLVEFDNLRQFGETFLYLNNIPRQVLRCSLAEIQPSPLRSPRGQWTKDVVMEFCKSVKDVGIVEAEIYAVVDDICYVTLKVGQINVNQFLLENGLAQYCEEGYMVKCDHDKRIRNVRGNDRTFHDYSSIYCWNTNEYIPPPPPEYCNKEISIRGPFSPMETSIYSIMCTDMGTRRSRIEGNSVNSILLTDYQNNNTKLIVAALVTTTQHSKELVARATTIMPNINGMAALVSLIFCPRMQLRRNAAKTAYVSLLTGLGTIPNRKEPIFKDHNLHLDLDFVLTNDDIESVNRIRLSMNKLLYLNPGENIPNIMKIDKLDDMHNIKKELTVLMEKNRTCIEKQYLKQPFDWLDDNDDNDKLYPDSVTTNPIFPLHPCFELHQEDQEKLRYLQMRCNELHNVAKMDNFRGNPNDLKCALCRLELDNIRELRIHLLCKLHKDREMQIGYKCQ